MAKKGKKTDRERLSENTKMLTNLLLYEATGGIVALPRGVESYTPPPIPFTERRALIDSVNKQLMVDMKIDPTSEETGFEMLKEELNERQRNSNKNGSGGITSSLINGHADEHGDSDDFAGSEN